MYICMCAYTCVRLHARNCARIAAAARRLPGCAAALRNFLSRKPTRAFPGHPRACLSRTRNPMPVNRRQSGRERTGGRFPRGNAAPSRRRGGGTGPVPAPLPPWLLVVSESKRPLSPAEPRAGRGVLPCRAIPSPSSLPRPGKPPFSLRTPVLPEAWGQQPSGAGAGAAGSSGRRPASLAGGRRAGRAGCGKPGVRVAVKVGCCGAAEGDACGMRRGWCREAFAAHRPNGSTSKTRQRFNL